MIIVSIVGPTMKDAVAQVKASRRHADLYEFRLDMIQEPDIVGLLSSTEKETIAVCRPKKEGGFFGGSERERVQLIEFAGALGVSFVDIELSADAALQRKFPGGTGRPGVILSAHLKIGPPKSVNVLYKRMKKTGAEVVKLAYPAQDASDILPALKFLSHCAKDRQKGISVAMGEYGEASRILYKRFGGWGTYASAGEGAEAASGQIPAAVLKRLYTADRLSDSTRIFGVIGHPLAQSKGVFLHNPLFQRAKKNAVYCRFPTRDLGRFWKEVTPILEGFSVTLPHKEAIRKHLSSVSDTAKAIGAVNTVTRDAGGFHGRNTDADGALDAIEKIAKVKGQNFVIVGAGGVARAIAFGAKKRGAHVTVVGRNAAKAKKLAEQIGVGVAPMKKLRELEFLFFVNATPVGMVPGVDETVVPGEFLAGKIVLDCVYNPRVTKLLRDAEASGASIISGTEMYVNQAARQSELYSGVKPSIRSMKKILGF